MAQEHGNDLLVHPALVVERYLEKCRHSGDFSDFLEAFELSARYRLATKPLVDFWKIAKKSYSSEVCLDQLFMIIQKFEVNREVVETKVQVATAHTEAQAIHMQILMDLGKDLAKRHIEFSKNKLPGLLAGPHASFRVCWPISPLLRNWYKENDPAATVSNFLQMMYPVEADPEPAFGYWGEPRPAIDKPHLDLARDVAFDIIKRDHAHSATKREFLRYATNAILGNVNPHRVGKAGRPNAEFALAALRVLPQCMFSGLLEREFANTSTSTESAIVGGNLQLMLADISWLFSRCWPENRRDGPQLANGHACLMYDITCLVDTIGHEIRKNADDENIAIAFDEATGQWRSMLDRLADFARRSVPMRSPIPIAEVQGLFGPIWELSAAVDDYSELHSFLLLSDLFDAMSRFNPVFDNDGFKPDDASSRWIHCIPYIQRLRVDGMMELSGALFAFLLFSQVRMFPTWMADWPTIREELIEALKSPARLAVLRTVEFATAMSTDRKDRLAVSLLEEFSPPATPDSARQSSIGMVYELHSERIEAESALRKFLGDLLWEKYSVETRQLLVDAECKWAEASPKIGVELQNWGELAVVFCKPIEAELKYRLTSAYRFWQEQKKTPQAMEKPTIGSFIKLLQEFKSLASPVQNLIQDAGVRIQDDAELVKQLIALKSLRNRGGHPGPFDAQTIMKVKNLLYAEGLLRRVAERLD